MPNLIITTLLAYCARESTIMKEFIKNWLQVIKRWVFILLVMALLFTVSLFLGISLQHLQLVRKYFAAAANNNEENTTAATATTFITTRATTTATTGTTSGSTVASSTPVVYNSDLTSEDDVVLNLLLIENSTQKTLMPPWDNMHSYIFQLEASKEVKRLFIKDHQSI